MSVTPTTEALIVALDFEGTNKVECPPCCTHDFCDQGCIALNVLLKKIRS